MSTPCCQISTPHRLVVSEYEVPKVLVSQKWGVYSETLCIYYSIYSFPYFFKPRISQWKVDCDRDKPGTSS